MVSKRKVELAGFDDETCVKKGGRGRREKKTLSTIDRLFIQ